MDMDCNVTQKPINLTIHKQNAQNTNHVTNHMTGHVTHTSDQNEVETLIKSEDIDVDDIISAATGSSSEHVQTVTVTTTRPGQTLLRQPTIILATSNPGTVTTATLKQAERLVLPKVNIKVEPSDRASSPEISK